MLLSFLLAATLPSAATPARACVPIGGATRPADGDATSRHRALRDAIGEAMPDAPTMVTLYGTGGHLATRQISVVVARSADGTWHGSAVGRSRIWIDAAPWNALPSRAWTLDAQTGRALDRAIACRYAYAPPRRDPSSPPPRGDIPYQIDVIRKRAVVASFDAEEGGEGIEALVLPPADK